MVTETQAKMARSEYDGAIDENTLISMAGSYLSTVEDMAFALTYYGIAPEAKDVLKKNWPDKYDSVNWDAVEDKHEGNEDTEEDGSGDGGGTNKNLQDVLGELNDG